MIDTFRKEDNKIRTVEILTDKFPLAIVDDYYSLEDLSLIWKELEFLEGKHQPPDETGSAANDEGENLKNNSGLFLDNIYASQHRDISSILNANGKCAWYHALHSQKDKHDDWLFNNMLLGNFLKWNTTLLSYYENEDYYDAHKDSSLITILHWLYKEPKRFEGGDIIFPDYDIGVKVENNKTIIFPGCISHQVLPVKMEEKYKNKGLGRYCITEFIHYTHEHGVV